MIDTPEATRDQLRSGERLLWVGRPDPAVLFTGADIFLVPFSLLWAGFMVFWEATAVGDKAPTAFALFGVPFVLMGVYYTVGRFFFKAARKRRTSYAITSERAIILIGRTITDTPMIGEPTSVRRSRDGDHASVTIGPTSPGISRAQYANTGLDVLNFGRSAGFAFYDVSEPDEMLRALDVARAAPRA